MKQRLKIILIIFIASSTAIISLDFISHKINHRFNNFNRLVPPHGVRLIRTLDLKYNSFYIAGVSSNQIFLANSTAPIILKSDFSLKDTQVSIIKMPEKVKLYSGSLEVDSPYFYITDRVTSTKMHGYLSDLIAKKYEDSTLFVDAKAISNSTFAIRTLFKQPPNYILGKRDIYNSKYQIYPTILTKQVDGIFCEDGMLNYDKMQDIIVYLYYYRNTFICLDTNFNIKVVGKTIDTNSVAKIKVTKIKSDNSYTLSEPPLLVNRNSCVYNGSLFINSPLLANNDDPKTLDDASIIDIYNLKTGEYKSSFYLPLYKGRKIASFQVFKDILVAVSDKSLLVYILNKNVNVN